jgi:hypothetical protein
MKNKNVNKLFWPGYVRVTDRALPGVMLLLQKEADEFQRMLEENQYLAGKLSGTAAEYIEDRMRATMGWDGEPPSEEEYQQAFDNSCREASKEALYFYLWQNKGQVLPHITRLLELDRQDEFDPEAFGGSMGDILWKFLLNGANSVRVFPDLAEALQRTKIRAPAEHLQMPYDYMEIIPPDSVSQSWILEDAAGRRLPVKSVMVEGPDWHTPYISVYALGAGPDGGLTSLLMMLSVEEIQKEDGLIDERHIVKAARKVSENSGDRVMRGTWAKIMRLTINTILYMNAEESDIRLSPQTQAADDQETAAQKQGRPTPPRPPSRFYDAGRKVRIPGARGGGGETGNGSKLKNQHWVRGFWRNQPYGPGRSKSVLKWIKPFIRGKGRGLPMLYGRNYEVEEPEQS